MIGAHVVLAYSIMGHVIYLYLWINVSLFFSHVPECFEDLNCFACFYLGIFDVF